MPLLRNFALRVLPILLFFRLRRNLVILVAEAIATLPIFSKGRKLSKRGPQVNAMHRSARPNHILLNSIVNFKSGAVKTDPRRHIPLVLNFVPPGAEAKEEIIGKLRLHGGVNVPSLIGIKLFLAKHVQPQTREIRQGIIDSRALLRQQPKADRHL